MPFHNGTETAPDGTATAPGAVAVRVPLLGAVAGALVLVCGCAGATALVRQRRCGGKVVSVSAVTLSDPTFPSS